MRCLTLITCLVVSLCAHGQDRPNVIFIFTDDHAAHAISAYGSKVNETPNIDRIAREGMLFRHCLVTNAICGPSRAVILTGKHSHKNGFMTNGNDFDGSQQTFPKLMRKAGYETAVFGKWHLKSDPTGFDEWQVLIGQGPYYNPPIKSAEGRRRIEGYTTDIVTDLTLDWLKNGRDRKKPFMLMCQHKAPHRNWMPGPNHLTMYDDVKIPEPPTLFDEWEGKRAAKMQEMTVATHLNRHDLKLARQRGLTDEQRKVWDAAYGPKNEAFEKAKLTGKDLVRWKYQRYMKDYLRCVASVDDNIGRLLEYLDDSGLAKNTIVIYSSDQGWYLGDHGWYDKRWMYEESLMMPLVVRWPGVVKAGSENRDLTSNLDFAETFLDIAGVKKPDDMQGESLVPLLEGRTPETWRESFYYHYYEYPGPHAVRRHYGVRTRTHKLIRFYGIDDWELYDLVKDPEELENVYGRPEYAEIQAELKKELVRLREHYEVPEDTRPIRRRQRNSRPKTPPEKVKLRLVVDQKDGARITRDDLDPSWKPLTWGARCRPEGDGVLLAHGGQAYGYSIWLKDGVPYAALRNENALVEVAGKVALPTEKWSHVSAMLTAKGELSLFVDGRHVARKKASLITRRPADSLTVGQDSGSPVGSYDDGTAFKGGLKDVRVYWGALDLKGLGDWVGK